MSLHVLCHPWQVQEFEDGISVQLTHRDLDVETLSILTDELCELAQEGAAARLTLDFTKVDFLTSVVIGKLFALDRRLREVGTRLVLSNLNPTLEEVLQAVSYPGVIACAQTPG